MRAADFLILIAGPLTGWLILKAALRFEAATSTVETAESPRANQGWPALITVILGTAVSAASLLLVPADLVVLSLLLGWLLLALSVIDMRTYTLPDALNACVFLTGAAMVWTTGADWLVHIAGAALGFGLLWIVETGYRRLRGRHGLGRGDAKLMGALGIWVGAAGVPLILLIASSLGVLMALASSWRKSEGVRADTAIAFGPWLALGGYAVWLARLV